MLRLFTILLMLVVILKPITIRTLSLDEEKIGLPQGFQVRYHPDGQLYSGDQVSIQLFVPTPTISPETRLRVDVVYPNQLMLGESTSQPQSTGTSLFTFLWVWDTRDSMPGEYRLKYSMLPEGVSWEETIQLVSPPSGPIVTWQTRETVCCILHYFSSSDAERDIDRLAEIIDERARHVQESLHYVTSPRTVGSDPIDNGLITGKLQINLIPRLLGQGGFTSGEITVTYSDGNPANTDVAMIIQHELTHLLDNQIGGDIRPLMFMEGISVFLAGGHYKTEPLFLRATALLHDGGYIPLNNLSEDFYSHQHESSYLEAAALVGFMLNTWGWESFNQFYRDIHQKSGQSTSDAINDGLLRHYHLSLRELDDRFVVWLENLPILPDLLADVELTAAYFDAIRDYQVAYDPSGDFRQVWLPDPAEMRQKGITADYLRSPETPINQTVTEQLHEIGLNWRSGLFLEALIDLQRVRNFLLLQK